MTYTQHELSAHWPAMSRDDYQALVADIEKHGQHNDAWMFDGQILDGWHRVKACLELGIEPKARQYLGDDPAGFVRSMNYHRRHETPTARGLCLVLNAQWRPRGRQHANQMGTGAHLTTAQIAVEADVSERTIKHIKAAVSAGLGDAMRDGKIEAKPAAELARKAPDVARRVVAKEITPAQGKAELKARESKPEKRQLPTIPAPNLGDELAQLRAKNMDLRAELIAMRAGSNDPQLQAEARDEIAGIRQALALEIELHDALKAQRATMEYQINDWKKQCAYLEKKLAKVERGE